ncbi:MAG: hypothetical protein KGS10_16185 [Chloroflexi bacterium]|nr:hypothetical protein [Chloroflexota bacterium]
MNLVATEGAGNDQFDAMYAKTGTLAAAGTLTVNLGPGDNDAYGVALSANDVFAIYIASTAGTGALQVEPAASVPLNTWLGASSAVKLPTPSFLFQVVRVAGRMDVNVTNRAFTLRNTGASSVDYSVIALVRR